MSQEPRNIEELENALLTAASRIAQLERERTVTRAAAEKAMSAWEPLVGKYSIGKVGENIFVSAAEFGKQAIARAETAEAALTRFQELLVLNGIDPDDTDSLKHRLEDWQRWVKDVPKMDIELTALRTQKSALMEAVEPVVQRFSVLDDEDLYNLARVYEQVKVNND